MPRRWVLGAVALVAMLGGSLLGVTDTSWRALAGLASGVVAINLLSAYLARADLVNRVWISVLALCDASLAGVLVVLLGPGGMAVLMLLAVLPYAWEDTKITSDIYGVIVALAYLAAVLLHGIWFARPQFGIDNMPAAAFIEAGVLLLSVAVLRRIPARLVARITVTRDLMRQARDGTLSVRAPATMSDELGLMERSFNEMLEDLAQTIFVVQKEADEVAVLAEVLSQSSQGVLESSDSVANTAEQLASAMSVQQNHAESGHESSSQAAEEASGLLERAERMAEGARGLVESAELGRERVQRAGETLVAVGEEVRTTAATVRVLSGMSERVGKFAHTISRIARQTHVLALNAAIEAAHSDGDQEGFSAVAEEVRVLAAESAASAREVAELIGDVQSRIDAVARAMGTGQEKVQDVGQVAGQAQTALDELYLGASKVMDLVQTTADTSKAQADRMDTLSRKMSQIAELSTQSSDEANSAAAAMIAQRATIQDLNAISTQLANLADRVRQSVARFSVLQPGQTTHEFSVPHDSAG